MAPPKGGVISVCCKDNYYLLSTKNVDSVKTITEAKINTGQFVVPWFSEQLALGEKVIVEIASRCDPDKKNEELYRVKQQYIKLGRKLLNEDIIQVWDPIVPFRYQSAVRRIVEGLQRGDITEDMLESFSRMKKR